MKGLAVLNDIRLPKKEGIALINMIREGFKNVVHSGINYKDRLVAMTIAMLEVMNLRERQEDLYTNYYDSSRKPQGIDLYLFVCLPLHAIKYHIVYSFIDRSQTASMYRSS